MYTPPRRPRRVGAHAVEGVGAGLDGGEDVVRFGNAQKVARHVNGQLVGDPADDGAQVLFLQRAADTEAAKAAAPLGARLLVQVQQAPHGRSAQVLVLGTLDDAPEGLEGFVGTCRR